MLVNDDFSGTDEEREANSSNAILSALKLSEKCFNDWQVTCQDIDNTYSLGGSGVGGFGLASGDFHWSDTKLDLFWASFEVLKPAVYAKPPRPAIAPMFSDNRPIENKTSELLERCAISSFVRSDIDEVMMATRDDLLFTGRGVIWVRYDTDGGQSVEYIHLDRSDFLHEEARKWSEVGWVAGGFWLTREEMKKRFKNLSDDQIDSASYTKHDDNNNTVQKCRVWEVWHKADNKVYWVTEGIDVILDESEPQIKLSRFFPCPRPAYATLKRRTLIPVPDWERYAIHFRKISDLTGRIYLLLDSVRMKGLIPAGGDVGDAIEQLIASDDDQLLIPVPGAAMRDSGMSGFVQWMPLAELAQAITGLIEARGQLISDFYELSGISDIMRGATEAQETLGAQQLKSHYGSVRVREKIDELQRIARDITRIGAEIIAEHFSKENIMEMAQQELPTKKDITKRIKEIEDAAEGELEALTAQAEQAAAQMQGHQEGMEQGPAIDPQEAEQGLKAAQQEILAKYGDMLAEAQSQVTIDDVMDLLRNDKARSFAFEIETDSTILTDEIQEKESRNEFMTTFMAASQGLMQFAAMGEQGAELAGQLIKFVMAPYRAGRQLDGAIEAFVEAAPEMAAAAGDGEGDEIAEATKVLAEAEMTKAQAAVMQAQAKAARDEADMAAKMQELQNKAAKDQQEAQFKIGKMQLDMTKQDHEFAAKMAELDAKQNLMQAQTAQILAKIGLDVRKQDLEEYEAVEASQQKTLENTAAVVGSDEII